MKAIQKALLEIVPPGQHTKAEQAEALLTLLNERLAELMGRQDLRLFQPFFESRQVAYELRRLQTAPEWHKWRVYYEMWGCLVCGEREQPHDALGMCKGCHRRTAHRLRMIVQRLNEKCERAEQIIDQERLAYNAYREAAPSVVPERDAPSTPAELPAPKKMGRPRLKPQIVPEEAGRRARQLRELAGLSQAELAAAAGVDRKTVISFERGDREPIPSHSAAIRKVLVESLVRAFWPE